MTSPTTTSPKAMHSALDFDRDGARQLQWLAESAHFALALGQLERAAAMFAGLQELVPYEPAGWLGMAEVALARHDLAAAAAAIDDALRCERCDAERMAWAFVLRARLAAAVGDAAAVAEAEETVLALQPDGPLAERIRQQRLAVAGPGTGAVG